MKSLAVIIARGGSKRIPHKNIKEFCGKPIIAYSIQAAQRANCFDTIMCSTDESKIADIAKRYGAEVPFMRSEENANDFATMGDVLTEVIFEYEKRNIKYDYLCCIYPTAPFVDAEKIKFGLDEMLRQKAAAALPVVKFSYPPQRGLKLIGNKLSMLDPSKVKTRSQDLEPIYHDIGQYYWFSIEALKKNANIMLLDPIAIVTSEIECQDIDTPEDWDIAEMKYRILNKKN